MNLLIFNNFPYIHIIEYKISFRTLKIRQYMTMCIMYKLFSKIFTVVEICVIINNILSHLFSQ